MSRHRTIPALENPVPRIPALKNPALKNPALKNTALENPAPKIPPLKNPTLKKPALKNPALKITALKIPAPKNPAPKVPAPTIPAPAITAPAITALAVTALAILLATALVACGSPGPTELTALPSTLGPTSSATPTPTGTPTVTPTPAATPTVAPRATRSAAPPPARTSTRRAPATTRPSAGPAGRSWSTEITFYGSADNDPPGSRTIAHPTVHQQAGGTGTYADPITMASDAREIAVGTRIYYPPLQKYFVMEDDCASCIAEWDESGTPHVDLWTGVGDGADFIACEHALTPGGRVVVEVGPPPGRVVDTRPLYGPGGCLR